MRVYYLRLTESDFIETPSGKLITDTINLYDNDFYTNYSAVTSSYGTTGFKKLWVGLNRVDGETVTPITYSEITDGFEGQTFTTDAGEVVNGRFIDKTGRIDLISCKFKEGTGSIRILSSDDGFDEPFEDFYESYSAGQKSWLEFGPYLESDSINIIDSDEFIKIELESSDEEIELLLRIEIDLPVMAPLYSSTRTMMNKFPQWMEMHESYATSTTPVIETPKSLGGSFINAVAGEWLEDIRRELTYRDFQRYITTIDMSQMAWGYRSTLSDLFVYSVVGDGTNLVIASSEEEFLSGADQDTCLLDVNRSLIHTKKEYSSLEVNGVELLQEPEHFWTYLDEMGLLVDLRRHHLEDNVSYKARIADVYKNRGSVGVEGLKLVLRRDLNLWKAFGATPDSDHLGATPEIISIEDIENDPKYFDPDGMPTLEFVSLVQKLSKDYPSTWGYFTWDKALWDAGGRDHSNYEVIPYRYDATPVEDSYIQSGVGDGDDLFVYEPGVITGPRDFNATLKVRGRSRTIREEYAPVHVRLAAIGHFTSDEYYNDLAEEWFTVEATLFDGSVFVHSFVMATQADIGEESATPTADSYVYYDLFSDVDDYTAAGRTFIDSDTHLLYGDEESATPTDELYIGRLPINDIASLVLRQGKWTEDGYEEIELSDRFQAWFTDDPVQLLEYDTVEANWPELIGLPAGQDPINRTRVAMKSLVPVAEIQAEGATEPYFFDVIVNADKATEEQPVTVDIPTFVWQPDSYEREIRLYLMDMDPDSIDHELEDPYENAEYGALIKTDTDDIFLPSSYIAVDGDTTWSTTGGKILPDTTTSVEFSVANLAYEIPPESWGYGGIGSFNGVEVPMLLRHSEWGKHVWTSGWLSNAISTPDTSAIDITGDFDIRAHVAAKRWAPGLNHEIVGKWQDLSNRSWKFSLTSWGALTLTWSPDGTSVEQETSTESLDVINGEDIWVRVTLDVDNGSDSYAVRFYTSNDGSNWVQLGDTLTWEYTTSVFNSSADLTVGSLFRGAIIRAQVYDGIDGALVADCYPADHTTGLTWVSDSTGETWTVNQSGNSVSHIVDFDCWAFSANEFLELPDRDELDVGTDDFTILVGGIKASNISSSMVLVGKKNSGVDLGYALSMDSTDKVQAIAGPTPTTVTHQTSLDDSYFVAAIQRSSGVLRPYANSVAATSSSTVSDNLDNDRDFRIGSNSSGSSNFGGLIKWVLLFKRALTQDEHTELSAWDGSVENEPSWIQTDATLYINANDTFVKEEYIENREILNGVRGSKLYPVDAEIWTPFEASHITPIDGVVDENGPWRNGVASARKSTNYLFTTLETVTREDFDVPDSEDYVLTWIGVESDNPRVLTWLDSNSIIPYSDSAQQDFSNVNNAFEEKQYQGEHYIETVSIRAKLRPGADIQWSPQVNSGYLYDKSDEYYLYAKPETESATPYQYEVYLEEPPRQGAPVIVMTQEATPKALRQVAFLADSSPVELSFWNTEIVNGTGTTFLFAAYKDIYDVTVVNLETGEQENLNVDNTETNIITLDASTDKDVEYELTYKVNNSFYVDYDYVDENGEYRSRVVFDKTAAQSGVDGYEITYETSDYDPATPIDIALNPLYTIQDEGFIYVSKNEYDLESIQARVSPSILVWDGEDYMLLTVQSLDENGNPKRNQVLDLQSDHCIPNRAQIITNEDGYGEALLFGRRNEALNPSFESTLDYWFETDNATPLGFPYDFPLYFSYGVTVEITQDEAYAGLSSLKVISLEGNEGDTNVIINTAIMPIQGESYEYDGYTISVYVKPETTQRYFTPTIIWYDEDQNELSSEDGDTVLEGTDWTRLVVSSDMPAGAAYFSGSFSFDVGPDETHYFDALLVERSSDANAYFSEDFTPEQGTITIIGDVEAELTFRIISKKNLKPRLSATTKVDQMIADGQSMNYVFGVLEDTMYGGIEGATVNWAKGRTLYDLFSPDGTIVEDGEVVTTDEGHFLVGPFQASTPGEPGFWFVSVDATPNNLPLGDVVYWLEAPDIRPGVDDNQTASYTQIIQDATPADYWPEYSTGPFHPASYNEDEDAEETETPSINWLPPVWFAIPGYEQYQMDIDSHEESEGF